MHDIKQFVEQTDFVKENLSRRKFDVSIIDKVLLLNQERKKLLFLVEQQRSEVKTYSKSIGKLKKNGDDATVLMNKVSQLKLSIDQENKKLEDVLIKQNELLSIIPNLVDEAVPTGLTEDDNIELKKWGEPTSFDFEPKDHVYLGENLKMLDFEKAAQITASRFVIYKGKLAKLERSLINYMLDKLEKSDYLEIIPPLLVNSETMYGTGQLPKFEEDLFKVEGRPWYLIPTAEVPVTNLKKGELFPEQELPLRYCAYTPCFRSEAGSYGKDTRGLIRLHQFNKVEMVNIVSPESSDEIHNEMIDMACSVLEDLNLPYRAVLLCGGDIGFSAKKCIDLEVWLPGQNKYREISSISNCGDFQSRRANIRYRDKNSRPRFAHTLNGSCLAVGRTVVAILENYQQQDGSIIIPEVLRPYTGFDIISAC